MNRYIIKFSKDGYIKYTSHLDILRLFKRSFKKTGLALRYSQGFNPHPKMSFGQPLSLGYSSRCELIEFETVEHHEPDYIKQKIADVMPAGIEIFQCIEFNSTDKALAAMAESAEYIVWIPIDITLEELNQKVTDYLKQGEIIAMKTKKKEKVPSPIDIKGQIRSIEAEIDGGCAKLSLLLDCGSTSNLSPELVISTFLKFANLNVERYKIDVQRIKVNFVNKLQV